MMENMQVLTDVQKASRADNQLWLMLKKLLEPKTKNFWLNHDEIVNKEWKEYKQLS